MTKRDWRKVFEIGDHVYGLSGSEWAVRGGDGRILLIEANKLDIALLNLLEHPLANVKSGVEEGLKRLKPLKASPFPYERTVLAGLRSRSEYWIEGALRWLESNSDDLLKGEEQFDLLTKIYNDRKRISQKTRHRARKVARMIGSPDG